MGFSAVDKALGDLSVRQVMDAEFQICSANPVLRPFDGSFIAADPSLLTPADSFDGKWHMFFHTNLGVYHFVSEDGVSFTKLQKIAGRAMRPNINRIDGIYYLFFEKMRSLAACALNLINLAKWKSEIYVTQSSDLLNWSAPKAVITNTREYERSERGTALSNPFLLRENGFNRLYYSCGLTFIKDCGFCEPTYISFAESRDITKNYISADSPLISPDKNDPYLNLCSGCLKVYKLSDGYIGVQNGIYEKDGQSHSAIILLTSLNGLDFKFAKVLLEPSGESKNKWMSQFVYASHLVRYGDSLRLYFNARDTSNIIKGRECIGYAEAAI